MGSNPRTQLGKSILPVTYIGPKGCHRIAVRQRAGVVVCEGVPLVGMHTRDPGGCAPAHARLTGPQTPKLTRSHRVGRDHLPVSPECHKSEPRTWTGVDT